MANKIRKNQTQELVPYTGADQAIDLGSQNITTTGTITATTLVGAGSGGGSWGSITGTLSAQTDLQSALDLKAATTDIAELAQDAVGTILTDSSSIDFTYTDATPAITAVVKPTSITNAMLAGAITGDKIDFLTITYDKIALDAGILTTQISSGLVSDAEFNYLNGVTSAIQTQLDAKVPNTGNTTVAGVKTFSSIPVLPGSNPTTANQATRKSYVDAIALTVDKSLLKLAARTIALTNGTLATAYENGDTVNGVVIATNDRIVLNGQTSSAENGIYVVNASGAPTRANDYDVAGEVLIGTQVYVTDGNSPGLYVMVSPSVTTLGTDPITFTQIAGLSNYDAGSGIDITGTTISINATTDEISEGVTNLYYTETRTQDYLEEIVANGVAYSAVGTGVFLLTGVDGDPYLTASLTFNGMNTNDDDFFDRSVSTLAVYTVIGDEMIVFTANELFGKMPIDTLLDVVITSPSTGQALVYDGANWINGGDATDIQIFTSSGTWTKPSGTPKITEIISIGGGAGGGSGRKGAVATARCGGGGGQGGSWGTAKFITSLLNPTETVTIGAGGAGGASQTTNSTNGNAGSFGGRTSFGGWFSIAGGAAGSGGSATAGAGGVGGVQGGFPGTTSQTTGGNGGAAIGSGNGSNPGTTTYMSGAGGASGGGITTGNVASTGGTGGGMGTVSVNVGGYGTVTNGGTFGAISTAGGNGNAAPTNSAVGGSAGGGGGSSITTDGGAGGAGALYGGGGGGGGAATNSVGNSGAGGAGAAGMAIVITYY